MYTVLRPACATLTESSPRLGKAVAFMFIQSRMVGLAPVEDIAKPDIIVEDNMVEHTGSAGLGARISDPLCRKIRPKN